MLSTYDQRRRWIIAWLQQRHIATKVRATVDVLNQDFVNAYIKATGAKSIAVLWGADKCRLLSRDLTRMCHEGSLQRTRQGLQDMGPDFPRWVWVYELPEHLQ
jgi:hypothetical protein